MREHITGTEFSPELSANIVHGGVEGYMCSDFLAENTRRAAALKTDCSRCDSCPEIPERAELQWSTFVTTRACTSVNKVVRASERRTLRI